jgi:transcription elongation factor Elf1
MSHICPVCGYSSLKSAAYKNEIGSFEICSSCGYQFEVTDMDEGITHEEWRKRWIDGGMKWWSPKPVPSNWNPEQQLKNLDTPDQS